MQVAKTMDGDSGMVVKRLSVPLGLEELMESLTKQVLLKKPKDIYIFASEYFEQLLKIRDQECCRAGTHQNKSSTRRLVKQNKVKDDISIKTAMVATKFQKVTTPIIFTNSKSTNYLLRKSSGASHNCLNKQNSEPTNKRSQFTTTRNTPQKTPQKLPRKSWKKEDGNKNKTQEDSEKRRLPNRKSATNKNEKQIITNNKRSISSQRGSSRSSSQIRSNKSPTKNKPTPKSTSLNESILVKGAAVNLENKINKSKSTKSLDNAIVSILPLNSESKKCDDDCICGINTTNTAPMKDEAADSDFEEGKDTPSIEKLSISNEDCSVEVGSEIMSIKDEDIVEDSNEGVESPKEETKINEDNIENSLGIYKEVLENFKETSKVDDQNEDGLKRVKRNTEENAVISEEESMRSLEDDKNSSIRKIEVTNDRILDNVAVKTTVEDLNLVENDVINEDVATSSENVDETAQTTPISLENKEESIEISNIDVDKPINTDELFEDKILVDDLGQEKQNEEIGIESNEVYNENQDLRDEILVDETCNKEEIVRIEETSSTDKQLLEETIIVDDIQLDNSNNEEIINDIKASNEDSDDNFQKPEEISDKIDEINYQIIAENGENEVSKIPVEEIDSKSIENLDLPQEPSQLMETELFDNLAKTPVEENNKANLPAESSQSQLLDELTETHFTKTPEEKNIDTKFSEENLNLPAESSQSELFTESTESHLAKSPEEENNDINSHEENLILPLKSSQSELLIELTENHLAKTSEEENLNVPAESSQSELLTDLTESHLAKTPEEENNDTNSPEESLKLAESSQSELLIEVTENHFVKIPEEENNDINSPEENLNLPAESSQSEFLIELTESHLAKTPEEENNDTNAPEENPNLPTESSQSELLIEVTENHLAKTPEEENNDKNSSEKNLNKDKESSQEELIKSVVIIPVEENLNLPEESPKDKLIEDESTESLDKTEIPAESNEEESSKINATTCGAVEQNEEEIISRNGDSKSPNLIEDSQENTAKSVEGENIINEDIIANQEDVLSITSNNIEDETIIFEDHQIKDLETNNHHQVIEEAILKTEEDDLIKEQIIETEATGINEENTTLKTLDLQDFEETQKDETKSLVIDDTILIENPTFVTNEVNEAIPSIQIDDYKEKSDQFENLNDGDGNNISESKLNHTKTLVDLSIIDPNITTNVAKTPDTFEVLEITPNIITPNVEQPGRIIDEGPLLLEDISKYLTVQQLNETKNFLQRELTDYSSERFDENLATKHDLQESSAIKIQSLWKGVLARKKMKQNLNIVNEDLDKAATVIQALFRGCMVRKLMSNNNFLYTNPNNNEEKPNSKNEDFTSEQQECNVISDTDEITGIIIEDQSELDEDQNNLIKIDLIDEKNNKGDFTEILENPTIIIDESNLEDTNDSNAAIIKNEEDDLKLSPQVVDVESTSGLLIKLDEEEVIEVTSSSKDLNEVLRNCEENVEESCITVHTESLTAIQENELNKHDDEENQSLECKKNSEENGEELCTTVDSKFASTPEDNIKDQEVTVVQEVKVEELDLKNEDDCKEITQENFADLCTVVDNEFASENKTSKKDQKIMEGDQIELIKHDENEYQSLECKENLEQNGEELCTTVDSKFASTPEDNIKDQEVTVVQEETVEELDSKNGEDSIAQENFDDLCTVVDNEFASENKTCEKDQQIIEGDDENELTKHSDNENQSLACKENLEENGEELCTTVDSKFTSTQEDNTKDQEVTVVQEDTVEELDSKNEEDSMNCIETTQENFDDTVVDNEFVNENETHEMDQIIEDDNKNENELTKHDDDENQSSECKENLEENGEELCTTVDGKFASTQEENTKDQEVIVVKEETVEELDSKIEEDSVVDNEFVNENETHEKDQIIENDKENELTKHDDDENQSLECKETPDENGEELCTIVDSKFASTQEENTKDQEAIVVQEETVEKVDFKDDEESSMDCKETTPENFDDLCTVIDEKSEAPSSDLQENEMGDDIVESTTPIMEENSSENYKEEFTPSSESSKENVDNKPTLEDFENIKQDEMNESNLDSKKVELEEITSPVVNESFDDIKEEIMTKTIVQKSKSEINNEDLHEPDDKNEESKINSDNYNSLETVVDGSDLSEMNSLDVTENEAKDLISQIKHDLNHMRSLIVSKDDELLDDDVFYEISSKKDNFEENNEIIRNDKFLGIMNEDEDKILPRVFKRKLEQTSASKIQNFYRKYRDRKHLIDDSKIDDDQTAINVDKDLIEEATEKLDEKLHEKVDEKDDSQFRKVISMMIDQKAASKIQRNYRRFKMREARNSFFSSTLYDDQSKGDENKDDDSNNDDNTSFENNEILTGNYANTENNNDQNDDSNEQVLENHHQVDEIENDDHNTSEDTENQNKLNEAENVDDTTVAINDDKEVEIDQNNVTEEDDTKNDDSETQNKLNDDICDDVQIDDKKSGEIENLADENDVETKDDIIENDDGINDDVSINKNGDENLVCDEGIKSDDDKNADDDFKRMIETKIRQKAASKIQRNFRRFRAREVRKSFFDSHDDDLKETNLVTKSLDDVTKHNFEQIDDNEINDESKEQINEDVKESDENKSPEESIIDDNHELIIKRIENKAASKIQRNFRRYQMRKARSSFFDDDDKNDDNKNDDDGKIDDDDDKNDNKNNDVKIDDGDDKNDDNKNDDDDKIGDDDDKNDDNKNNDVKIDDGDDKNDDNKNNDVKIDDGDDKNDDNKNDDDDKIGDDDDKNDDNKNNDVKIDDGDDKNDDNKNNDVKIDDGDDKNDDNKNDDDKIGDDDDKNDDNKNNDVKIDDGDDKNDDNKNDDDKIGDDDNNMNKREIDDSNNEHVAKNVDVDDNPNLDEIIQNRINNKAASKIQRNFRRYKTRKQRSSFFEKTIDADDENNELVKSLNRMSKSSSEHVEAVSKNLEGDIDVPNDLHENLDGNNVPDSNEATSGVSEIVEDPKTNDTDLPKDDLNENLDDDNVANSGEVTSGVSEIVEDPKIDLSKDDLHENLDGINVLNGGDTTTEDATDVSKDLDDLKSSEAASDSSASDDLEEKLKKNLENRSAIKIQRGFKRFKARKTHNSFFKIENEDYDEIVERFNKKSMDNKDDIGNLIGAAIKIQKIFKGYLARKDYNNLKQGGNQPFYLHDSSTNFDNPIAAAVQVTSRKTNQEPSIALLHSGEFHDSLPLNVSSTEVLTPESSLNRTDSNILMHSGELHDGIVLGEGDAAGAGAAGDARMTSTDQVAHASLEDVPTLSCADNGFGFQRGTSEMETRKNATITEKKLETDAATKIQAGFRGYKVRKELKTKNGTMKTKRSLRRKSSGKLTEGGKIMKKDDLEERSATKIQAGIRGFLVRKKQMKNKKENQSP